MQHYYAVNIKNSKQYCLRSEGNPDQKAISDQKAIKVVYDVQKQLECPAN